MSQRGIPQKTRDEHKMTIHRGMVTRNYLMTWDLDKCVGCQIGPLVCPKEALTHVPVQLENGRIAVKASVDVDEKKCVNCGMCVVSCPTHAISLTINGKPEIPVHEYEAYPEYIAKTIFHREQFDFALKDFVIDNCSVDVISYDENATPCAWILRTASTAASVRSPATAPSKYASPGRAPWCCTANAAWKAALPALISAPPARYT